MEVVSGFGLDHQGRGYRVRGDIGPRQSSKERTLASKGKKQKKCSFPP